MIVYTTIMNTQIPSEQTGFTRGRGTREQILNLGLLIEIARKYNIRTILYIIAKAVTDRTKGECPTASVWLIKRLCEGGTANARINKLVASENFHTEKDVLLGYILSPSS